MLKQYVHEPICFVKIGIINYITNKLNNVDPNIKFNYEVERDCKLPFLDVLLIKKRSNIITTLYHKATTNDIYLNWESLLALLGKKRYSKNKRRLCYLICSSIAFKKKINHLKKVFHKKMVNLNGLLIKFWMKEKKSKKPSVNNVSKESKVSPVTDLKRHLLTL